MNSRIAAFTSIIAVAGCATPQAEPVGDMLAPRLRDTIIYRSASYPNADLAAHKLGHLHVVFRSADQPTRSIDANVTIWFGDEKDGRLLVTPMDGYAKFDSIRVGQYRVRATRMGYGGTTVSVPVTPGCRTDVEIYAGVMSLGIAPPPPTPGRAVITTCRPE